MNPKKLVGFFLLVVIRSKLVSAAGQRRLLPRLASSDEQQREDRLAPEALGTTGSAKGLPFLAPHQCSPAWMSWPFMQAEGQKQDTFLVFRVFNAVGNLFITLHQLIRVARFLEVGVVLDSSKFPGFRVALDPSDVMWDVSSEPIIQRAREIEQDDGVSASGMHSMTLNDGALILSDVQFSRLELALRVDVSTLLELVSLVNGGPVTSIRGLMRLLDSNLPASIAPRVEPCAWNMLFSRSPALVENLVKLSPWESTSDESSPSTRPPHAYVAWHIRTVDQGERARDYNASVHTYMITEPPRVVCPTFGNATTAFVVSCSSLFPDEIDIFVSANSKDLARECIAEMAVDGLHGGQIDMGSRTHTEFSDDPNASMNAFLDLMSLIDATAIVCTASSFSGMVGKIRGLSCKRVVDTVLSPRRLQICVSQDKLCEHKS
ncbi:unnamed protein product [Ectocarpus sp. 4 AP-2014]